MNNCTILPLGYRKTDTIDLMNHKKEMVIVNLGSIAIAAGMLVLGWRKVSPVRQLASLVTEKGILPFLGIMALVLLFSAVYVVLHELVHGLFFRLFGKTKPHYGFNGLYAWAGSPAFFNRSSYAVIGLSPIVIWGLALAVVQMLAPPAWFWMVYYIQMLNLSGGAGDLYVMIRLCKAPADTLVQDDGKKMDLYTPVE